MPICNRLGEVAQAIILVSRSSAEVRIRAFGLSHVGQVRSDNEDHFCIGPRVAQHKAVAAGLDIASRQFEQSGFLAAVADGMGGAKGGHFSSWVVLEALQKEFFEGTHRHETGKQLQKRITKCLNQSCRKLRLGLKQKGFRKGGTTVAGVVLKYPNHLICFHVGDSRVLKFSEQQLAPLTIDHTPVGPALARGKMTEEQALSRSDCNKLTRSFGLGGNVQPEVRLMDFSPGDHLLLTTDGFHSPGRGLDADSISSIMRSERRLQQQVTRMVEMAVTRDGTDNTTLVIVRVDQASEAWAQAMFEERRKGAQKKKWWFW